MKLLPNGNAHRRMAAEGGNANLRLGKWGRRRAAAGAGRSEEGESRERRARSWSPRGDGAKGDD